jgi:protein pelota
MLTLQVTRVEFTPPITPTAGAGDPASSAPVEPTASLQITGRVVEENEHVKMGAFHTLDIEANRDIRIEKLEWDSISIERFEEASQPGRGAEVGAIVCGEGANYPLHLPPSHTLLLSTRSGHRKEEGADMFLPCFRGWS